MEQEEQPEVSKQDRKKLRLAYILLIALSILGIAIVVWLAWIRPAQESAGIDSFDECVSAGHPVQESDPPACVTPDGERFTGPRAQPEY